MIKNNKFYLKNFSNIVFFGQPNPKIIQSNKIYILKSTVITSLDQSKFLKKNKIDYQIFNSIDQKCINFLKKNFNIKNTLFFGFSPRYIFKQKTINLFENNFVNVHNTRLPLDCGGGGSSWSIMREDRICNLSIFLMTGEIDGGPIIKNELSLYPKHCLVPIEIESHIEKIFLKFYETFIQELLKGEKFDLKEQTKYLSRYNPRLNTEISGFIDWNLDSYDLINFINAFDMPYKGASTYLNNGDFGKLYIRKVQLHGGDTPNHPHMTGIVSRHDINWITVCTKSKHMLLIEEITNEKGKNIINLIKPGDRFFTPIDKLDRAKSKRIYYNSLGLKKN
jgi:methionyl-tRNA formyltransferase